MQYYCFQNEQPVKITHNRLASLQTNLYLVTHKVHTVNMTTVYKCNDIICISLAVLEHVAEIDAEIFLVLTQMMESSRMIEILCIRVM